MVENCYKSGFDFKLERECKKDNLIELVAYALFSRGFAKDKFGDLNGALLDYNRAIELKPDYANALLNRGYAKYELGDLEGALLDYNKLIELEPDDASAFNNRGIVKQKLEDFNGALIDYDRAIKLKSDTAKRNKERLLKYLKELEDKKTAV